MVRPRRSTRPRRAKVRRLPDENGDRRSGRNSGRSREPLVRIDVSFTLSRQIMWPLAGVTIGRLYLPDDLIERLCHLVRTLLPH